MNNAVIAAGSNIQPVKNVELAEKELSELGVLLKKSKFFFTKPLLYENQDNFYNGVFFIQIIYEHDELKQKLKLIEQELGRIRTKNKNGPRTIDLDIVLFNGQVVDKDVFTRDFIKLPIIEILPELKPVISSLNYQNNFEDIKAIIDGIVEVLQEKPLAILSLGNWFFEQETHNKLIDIIVLTCKNRQNYKMEILNHLKSLGIDKIADSKISINLFTISELNNKKIDIDKTLVLYGNFSTEL